MKLLVVGVQGGGQLAIKEGKLLTHQQGVARMFKQQHGIDFSAVRLTSQGLARNKFTRHWQQVENLLPPVFFGFPLRRSANATRLPYSKKPVALVAGPFCKTLYGTDRSRLAVH
jgi:hypothetical protein